MRQFLLHQFDFDIEGYESAKPDYSWITDDEMARIRQANVVAIIGSSGSGKSVLGKHLRNHIFSTESTETEQNARLVDTLTEDMANNLLTVGLKSLPTWLQPFKTLSCGEQYRALLALRLRDDMLIDEFTSHLDRLCAAACANGVRKLVERNNFKCVTVATCHRDILPFLRPDAIVDCDRRTVYFDYTFARPTITIEPANGEPSPPNMGYIETNSTHTYIHLTYKKSSSARWKLYNGHHYMTSDMHKAATCHEFFWNGIPVAFVSTLTLVGRIKNAIRESRLVVLPFAQGLGIGVVCSEYVARLAKKNGKRYFTKTSHPALGVYRNKSDLWRGTANNGKRNPSQAKQMEWLRSTQKTQACFCHEFMEEPNT